jgi:ComF family protein
MRLLASQCEVCRRWGGARLCAACRARFTTPAPRCPRCGERTGGGAQVCGPCLRTPPSFASAVCAVDYGFPWDRLIGGFKFREQPELAICLAAELSAAVRAAGCTTVDLVVPVPLSTARLRERGFNQAWELARRVAATLRLSARADLLRRLLDTAHQADLSRAERLANLRAAFVVEPAGRDRLRGKTIALVDDVMTTGATAENATRVLLNAGAAAVHLWVLARTATR